DHTILGGQAGSAIDLDEDGSFTATFTVDKAALDEFAGNPEGNFGVYTFTRAPGVAPFETYTPLTFARAVSDVTVATSKASAGIDVPVEITVSGAVPVTGEVTLHDGGSSVGTAPLTEGAATITLPRPRAGARTLTATYTGDANHDGASATRSLVVSRAGTTTRVKVNRKPGAARRGRAVVTVRSTSGLPLTGRFTLVVKQGKRTARKLSTTVKRSGRTKVALPPLGRGRYQVVVRYRGDNDHARSKGTARLRVAAR
ncbi:Ig-like domain-containing protein, partial [Nocardioides sp.]|uniref:Ig-like domain-containing protein n=1 Tax=Nocardioides sp. TaxID=35761 RepID=UPI0027361D94